MPEFVALTGNGIWLISRTNKVDVKVVPISSSVLLHFHPNSERILWV